MYILPTILVLHISFCHTGSIFDGAKIEVKLANPPEYPRSGYSHSKVKPSPPNANAAQMSPIQLESQAPPTHVTPSPTNSKSPKNSIEILEEICRKNNWSSPVYSLYSMCPTHSERKLFQYKVQVFIPELCSVYIPLKYSRTVEEAECSAAEYCLVQVATQNYSPPTPEEIIATCDTKFHNSPHQHFIPQHSLYPNLSFIPPPLLLLCHGFRLNFNFLFHFELLSYNWPIGM